MSLQFKREEAAALEQLRSEQSASNRTAAAAAGRRRARLHGNTEGTGGTFSAITASGQSGPTGFHLPDSAELRVLPQQLGHWPHDVLDHLSMRRGDTGRHLRAGQHQTVRRRQACFDCRYVAPAYSARPSVGPMGPVDIARDTLLGEKTLPRRDRRRRRRRGFRKLTQGSRGAVPGLEGPVAGATSTKWWRRCHDVTILSPTVRAPAPLCVCRTRRRARRPRYGIGLE